MAIRIIIEDTGQPASGVEIAASAGSVEAVPELPAASNAGPPPDDLVAAHGGGVEESELERDDGEVNREGPALAGIDAGPPDMSLADLISSLGMRGPTEADGHA